MEQSNTLLSIKNLHVSVDDSSILKGVDLSIHQGEVHCLMGPNGSGKTSLAYSLMGHPNYTVQNGTMSFCGELINDLSPDKRARKGLFLAFQNPLEIEGLPFADFLRQSYNVLYAGTEKQLGLQMFRQLLAEKMALLGISKDFVARSLNFGFSGGEKKRAEMLQLAILEPKLVVLDEIDSGLDVDALAMVCTCLQKIIHDNPSTSLLIITHYNRILHHVRPHFVHVMQDGLLVKSGDIQLVNDIEAHGYEV